MDSELDMDVTPSLHQQLGKFRGALAGIATQTGYSRQHIIDVLRGHRQNAYIVREARKKLNELRENV